MHTREDTNILIYLPLKILLIDSKEGPSAKPSISHERSNVLCDGERNLG